MSIGHGLLNTLIGIRALQEGYTDALIGGFTIAYYLGFIVGTYVAVRWVNQVGHIRTFAACATLASSLTLGFVLAVDPVGWTIFRFVYGIMIAGLYMVIESWLNGVSQNKERGRILSFYMIISYFSIMLAQGFIIIATTDGFYLFAVCSILLSLALVPLTISRSVQPTVEIDQETFGFKRLFKTSPLATVAGFSAGLTLGAIWGFGPVFLLRLGFDVDAAALFMAVILTGGLVFQWPIGTLSDWFGRRFAIAISSFLAIFSALLMIHHLNSDIDGITLYFLSLSLVFGGGSYALYSLCLALMNDFIQPKNLVKASGGLLAIHGIGAVFGPFISTGFMALLGGTGLLYFTTIINSVVLLTTLAIYVYGKEIPEETSEDFVAMPRTGRFFLKLDPRRPRKRRR